MKLIRWAAVVFSTCIAAVPGNAQRPSSWDQPAAALAEQIAGIVGPGQAHLTMRNLSNISNDALPAIRKLLEQDLKVHGVGIADEESANSIRVTLSENARGQLWVGEVVEGNVTQVAMVQLGSAGEESGQTAGGWTLRAEKIFASNEPVLAGLETPNGLVILEPEQIVFEARTQGSWREQNRVSIEQRRPIPRDPRGILLPEGGAGFEAWLAGTECIGSYEPSSGHWTASCHASDDPWPISSFDPTAVPEKAFFNAARNYFTGVLTPNVGVDPPPFYAAAWIPRAAEAAALVTGNIDGKLLVIENGTSKPIAGTRDWGSDFAVIRSGCGAGAQIIASSSGEAVTDSLRAYELPALEAVPVSAPLEVGGTVVALWPAPDGKSVYAAVRAAANKYGAANRYEVDRVSALCN